MAHMFVQPIGLALSNVVDPLSGAKAYFYDAQTPNPRATYTTPALNVEHPVPVPATSFGRWPPIWIDPAGGPYKVDLKNAAGVSFAGYPIDNIPVAVGVDELLASIEAGGPTASDDLLNVIDRDRLLHYTDNATPGDTDLAVALQTTFDARTNNHPQINFDNQIALGAPLLLRESGIQNASLIGGGRLSSGLEPALADIKTDAQGENCLIFNQKNNGHLHLQSFSISDDVVYTGKVVYAVEGGGTDGSGQAMFSPVFTDLWLALSSNNSGIFKGGFSNLFAHHNVYESVKNYCFGLFGAGNGDQSHTDNVMNFAYDSYLYQADDTYSFNVIRVNGLHCYQHLRGPQIELVKGSNLIVDGTVMEAHPSNVGTIGVTKLANVRAALITNNLMTIEAGVPRGDVGYEINASTSHYAKYSSAIITADIGLKISGTGVVKASFTDIDFVGCGNGAEVTAAASGELNFYGCTFSNMDKYGFLDVPNSLNWNFYGCTFKNAGMDGTTTARIFDLSTTGKVRLIDCTYGQDDALAAATHFFRKESGGTFEVIRSRQLGVPPTAVKTGAGEVLFVYEEGYGGVIASAASITLPSSGGIFEISGTTNITSMVAANNKGRTVKLIFQSTPTFTNGSNLKLSANLVATPNDTISLICDGTNFLETGRSVNAT